MNFLNRKVYIGGCCGISMVTVKCDKCKHRWEYRGKINVAWCANCGNRVKIIRREVKQRK